MPSSTMTSKFSFMSLLLVSFILDGARCTPIPSSRLTETQSTQVNVSFDPLLGQMATTVNAEHKSSTTRSWSVTIQELEGRIADVVAVTWLSSSPTSGKAVLASESADQAPLKSKQLSYSGEDRPRQGIWLEVTFSQSRTFHSPFFKLFASVGSIFSVLSILAYFYSQLLQTYL